MVGLESGELTIFLGFNLSIRQGPPPPFFHYFLAFSTILSFQLPSYLQPIFLRWSIGKKSWWGIETLLIYSDEGQKG